MIYKKRSRIAHLPKWQMYSSHFIFVLCSLSGIAYILAHELHVPIFNIESHSILIAHGSSAYFFAVLFGAVMPAHIKAAWKAKRNIVSGIGLTSILSILLFTGLLLYYGSEEIRTYVLWTHWIIGGSLALLFPCHVIMGRRANYLAIHKHSLS